MKLTSAEQALHLGRTCTCRIISPGKKGHTNHEPCSTTIIISFSDTATEVEEDEYSADKYPARMTQNSIDQ